MEFVATYKKDMQYSYLIIDREEQKKEDYCVKMLKNNTIKGILKPEIRMIDERQSYYYDITTKQAMISSFEKGQLRKQQIKKLVISILKIMERGMDYLLCENDFVLNPEYIFIHPSSFEVNLCYVPGYQVSIQTQLCNLMEYFMNKVNYEEKEAVQLVYDLYKISKESDCTYQKLYEVLEDNKIPPVKKIEETIEQKEEQVEIKEEQIIQQKPKEKLSIKQFVLCILSVISCLFLIFLLAKLGLFYSKATGRLDYIKLIVSLITIMLLEILFLNKMLSPKEIKNMEINIKHNKLKKEEEKEEIELEKEQFVEFINKKEEPEQYTKKELEHLKEFDIAEETECLLLQEEEQTVLLHSAIRQEQQTVQVILTPLDKEQEIIEIREFPFLIGKLQKNVNYVLKRKEISRFHAKIEKEEENFYLTDLDSTNGTYINGIRLKANEKEQIHIKDVITFANVGYRVKQEEK